MTHCLPMSALVGMTANGYGSTRGFDELTAHPGQVVDEFRRYQSYAEVRAPSLQRLSFLCRTHIPQKG